MTATKFDQKLPLVDDTSTSDERTSASAEYGKLINMMNGIGAEMEWAACMVRHYAT